MGGNSRDARTGGEALGAFLLTLALGVGMLAAFLALLAPFAPPPVDPKEAALVLGVNPADLKPEPLERFLYATGVPLLPLCLLFSHLLVRRVLAAGGPRRALSLCAPAVEWLLTPLALLLLVAAVRAEDPLQRAWLLSGGPASLVIAAALALAAALPAGETLRRRAAKPLSALAAGAAATLYLAMLAFAVFDKEHIRNVPIYWASFNAFFHSVVQVYFGRELTVDLTNLYGLYPHFLEPLFRVIGLTVFSFTLVMGLLNCLAFACLHRFLARETRGPLLPILGLSSAVFICYAAGKVVEQDCYFQYHPLRMLFPALALLAAQAVASGRVRPAGLGALGAAATLWNPDSGLIVLASLLLLLGYDALLGGRSREIPRRLLLAFAGAAAFLVAFSLMLRLRFGAFPDYAQLFGASKAFYLYGNFMLPMPPFGLWVPVIAVYAAGLLHALRALVDRNDARRPRLTFFLSVLGAGLFVHYQGRSVLGNLTSGAYPAILLLALFADDLLRDRTSPRPAARLLTLAATLTLLSCSLPGCAAISPAWVRIIATKIRATRLGVQTEVLRDASFLQEHLRPGEKVLILSYQSGLFHLLTRTTSPLNIPGTSEIAYRKDFRTYYDYAYRGKGPLVVDRSTMKQNFIDDLVKWRPQRVAPPFGNLIVFPAR